MHVVALYKKILYLLGRVSTLNIDDENVGKKYIWAVVEEELAGLVLGLRRSRRMGGTAVCAFFNFIREDWWP